MKGKKVLLVTALAVLGCVVAANAAYLSENFDSGVNNGWTMVNDTGGLGWPVYPSPSGVAGDMAWLSYDGLITRAAKAFDDGGSNVLILDYDFYAQEATTSSRSFGGFADCTNPAAPGLKGLVRIGTNNQATYYLHYYTTALQQVSTGVAVAPGWHHVQIKLAFGDDPAQTQLDWTLDAASGSVVAAIGKPNGVVIGYNYSNGTAGIPPDSSIWYDNINVVPEPAAIALLGLGTLLCRRRRA